ncbi:MAG TPA: energy transducer TonB [Allosphingosinicella sp.]|nr:energy transducer TonB [Allosphingosinicella sp.]
MAASILLSAILAILAAPASVAPSPSAAARDSANNEVILGQYPERARRAGEQGSVVFKVALDREGYATSCNVTQSSGFKRLDEETCDLILDRGIFKGVRGPDGRRTNVVTEGVVNWRLPKGTATTRAPVRVAAAVKTEKKICRRRVKTGSLVDSERLCATASEWSRMSQRTQQEWGALQGAFGHTNNGT